MNNKIKFGSFTRANIQNPNTPFWCKNPALAPVEPPGFTIEGMAAKGRVTVIAGPPGSGKSFLVQIPTSAETKPILKTNLHRAFLFNGRRCIRRRLEDSALANWFMLVMVIY